MIIDNSSTEKAAVRQLELTQDARGFLLCYFHFLQDWERFIISKESAVSKLEKNGIMVELRELMHCRSEELFKKKVGGHACTAGMAAQLHCHSSPDPQRHAVPSLQLGEFYTKHRLRRKLVARMKKDWAPLAEKWACWGAGRLDPAVMAMLCDTNNLSEAFFRLLKYTDLGRNAQSSLQQLVDVLLNTTVPRYMQQRAHQVVGRASSDQVARAERVKQVVQGLASSGSVVPQDTPFAAGIGRAAVGDCIVYLGDMSCSCSYSGGWGGHGGGLGLRGAGWGVCKCQPAHMLPNRPPRSGPHVRAPQGSRAGAELHPPHAHGHRSAPAGGWPHR